MPKVTQTSSRKADHIRINLEEDVRSGLSTGLEHYHFIHQALPELNLEDINLSSEVFERNLSAPILISSMTGGTDEAGEINRTLAEAAQETGIAMGLGSQRAAVENPELSSTFQVRQYAPDILLLANLGAVQLNYGYGVEECQQAVDMIEADALILHLNALQEAVQPEGDTRFAGLLSKIESVCRALPVPVIVKEVGWGFSEEAARQLEAAGVSAIDVAGAGGTSWTQVEMHRAKNQYQAKLAAAFLDWGIPTVVAINNIHTAAPRLKIFASGGLRDGIDIAKCIALGASLGGMASPFLKAAKNSLAETIDTIGLIQRQMQVAMFACGAKDIYHLKKSLLIKS
ncbi:MAG: type 2 isopentenyl-diphosphate Delta-isomerase [Chloroflexota bacterium]|nr:MAG: type 2 isopentenyl-diphosphate Delta-isomerase [Chloroflexota bacterium]